ncbi:hypothetical protein HN604_01725 [archaeon]|jgi:hypothetical protein|nr:hypothetical protein [archaeon]MBT6182972.1 hypothetical protein [archaeon]MBT7251810.1 hypothetical protein [archaeon]MBT7660781.1 hypothetical protein [archaeon]
MQFQNKRGSTDWTVKKLLTIVLLVLLLLLIVRGYILEGFNPIIEKYEGKFDEVLYNFKTFNFDQISENKCLTRNIAEVYQGESFVEQLMYLGTDSKKIELTQCTDGTCFVKGSEFGKWTLFRRGFTPWYIGKFQNDKPIWQEAFLLKNSLEESKFNYDFYSEATKYLEENNLEKEYESMFNDVHVFYSRAIDSESQNDGRWIYAVGWHDSWNIYLQGEDGNLETDKTVQLSKNNRLEYIDELKKISTIEMINTFKSYADNTFLWNAFDDEIYYSTLTLEESKSSHWNDLLTYGPEYGIGNKIPSYDENNQLDSNEDISEVQSWIRENMEDIYDISNLQLEFFEDFHEGESIQINSETYEILVGDEDIGREITLSKINIGDFLGDESSDSEWKVVDIPFDVSNPNIGKITLKLESLDKFNPLEITGNGLDTLGEHHFFKISKSNIITLSSQTRKLRLEVAPPFAQEKFPVILTEYKNDKWQEIGAEQDYKLTLDEFHKKYLTTATKKFLENNCPTKT